MVKTFLNKIFASAFLRDSFWSLAGSVLSKGLLFVGSVFVAKQLGKISFGEFNIIKNTVLSFSILTTLGIGYTSTQFIANEEDSGLKRAMAKACLKITFLTAIFLGSIIYFSKHYVARNLFFSEQIESKMLVISAWVVINALSTALIGVFSGYKFFKELAIVNTIFGIVSFLLVIFLTSMFGIDGAILSLSISQLVFLFSGIIILNRKGINLLNNNEKRKIDKKRILKISFPLALQEIAYSVGNWLIFFLIVKYLGQAEYGLYSGAFQWLAVMLTIPGILRNVMLSYFASSKNKGFYSILKKSIFANIIIVIIPMLVILPFTSLIENKIYGADFKGIGILIFYALTTSIFMCVGNVYTQALISKNINWSLFIGKLVRDYGIVILIVFLNFINSLSLQNVFLSTIFFHIIFIIWAHLIIRKNASIY